MDPQNREAISNLLTIVADIEKNVNVEENLIDLTNAIDRMDQQIEGLEDLANVDSIINNCIYIKCILLELKVLILEKNYTDLNKIEKQIKDLLSGD
jgi:hypothetical protein